MPDMDIGGLVERLHGALQGVPAEIELRRQAAAALERLQAELKQARDDGEIYQQQADHEHGKVRRLEAELNAIRERDELWTVVGPATVIAPDGTRHKVLRGMELYLPPSALTPNPKAEQPETCRRCGRTAAEVIVCMEC